MTETPLTDLTVTELLDRAEVLTYHWLDHGGDRTELDALRAELDRRMTPEDRAAAQRIQQAVMGSLLSDTGEPLGETDGLAAILARQN